MMQRARSEKRGRRCEMEVEMLSSYEEEFLKWGRSWESAVHNYRGVVSFSLEASFKVT